MSKVKLRASKEDVEKAGQDQGDFVAAPAGLYVLTGVECNPGFSKDKDGEEVRSRPRLECIYKITGVGIEDKEPTDNYGQVWDYVAFSDQSGWSRARFGKAVGAIPLDADDDVEVDYDTEDFPGVRVIARLKVQKGRTKDDPPRNKIASLLHMDAADQANEDAFGADSGSDEPDDDVFGVPEQDDGDSGGEQSEEAFRSELEAKDLKELGGIAKDDYELDPKDSIVKVKGKLDNDKTKAKLIDAIIEAATAAPDEEEDPF